MRELFDIRELVRIGVEDETSGVAFYSTLAGRATSAQLRRLFGQLAEQESYHKTRFEEILETLGTITIHEEYTGEYLAYLQTMTGMRAFPDPDAARAMANECKNDADALDLATRFERDTLILMGELKGLVPPEDEAIVNELIREEQQHLVMLDQARQALV